MKGTQCVVCGYALKHDYDIAPIRNCGNRPEPIACPHFLGGLDPPQATLLFGCGCASSRASGIEVTVSGCELHGRCVTFAKGTHLADATIQRCVVCAYRPQAT